MSDGEDSNCEFYYPEEQETAEERDHFDNVEASKDTGYMPYNKLLINFDHSVFTVKYQTSAFEGLRLIQKASV